MRPARLLLLVLIAGGYAAGDAGGCQPRSGTAVAPAKRGAPEVVRSNVLRADYAGSKVCGDCHSDLHESFERSAMHRMTRLPATTQVRAPFDRPGGTVFRFKEDQVRLETRDG